MILLAVSCPTRLTLSSLHLLHPSSNFTIRHNSTCHPESGVQLIHSSVGLNPQVALQNPASAQEPRLTLIAGAGIDLHAFVFLPWKGVATPFLPKLGQAPDGLGLFQQRRGGFLFTR